MASSDSSLASCGSLNATQHCLQRKQLETLRSLSFLKVRRCKRCPHPPLHDFAKGHVHGFLKRRRQERHKPPPSLPWCPCFSGSMCSLWLETRGLRSIGLHPPHQRTFGGAVIKASVRKTSQSGQDQGLHTGDNLGGAEGGAARETLLGRPQRGQGG